MLRGCMESLGAEGRTGGSLATGLLLVPRNSYAVACSHAGLRTECCSFGGVPGEQEGCCCVPPPSPSPC